MFRRSILKWLAFFILGCLLPFYAIACTPQPSETPESPATTAPLSVGVQPWIGFQGHYIAMANDLFTPEGITVTENFFQVATDVNTALAAGRVDVAWIGAPDLLTMVEQKPDLKIIMASDYSNGADGIIGRGIAGPQDLQGKKVAREDAPYAIVFLGEYLKQADLTEADLEIVPIAAGDAVAAFIAGEVDAATTYEPWLSQAVNEGGAEILFTTKDTAVIPLVLATSEAVINDRRDDLLAYLRAIDNALTFAQENPDQAAEISAKALGVTAADIPPQLAGIKPFTLAGNRTDPFNPDSPLSLVKSLQSASDTLYELGKIPQPIDATSLVEESLVVELTDQ